MPLPLPPPSRGGGKGEGDSYGVFLSMIPVILIHRIFAVCIVLGVAILVHEVGHLLLAKRKGVRVEKCSRGIYLDNRNVFNWNSSGGLFK